MGRPYSLVIRARDNRCCAERGGKRLTGWLKDPDAVLTAMYRKEPENRGGEKA